LSISIAFNHDCIILDACCIINLYASDRMGEILDAIPAKCVVAETVMEKEVLRIYSGPITDVRGATERIDLQPFADSGRLIIAEIESEGESLAYIELATKLDDGEAITGALAINRNWAIGTDDKAAVNFFRKRAPQLQIVSTLEMIRYWADTINPAAAGIYPVLKDVQLRANYEPGKTHPLYEWWKPIIDSKKR
jgi:predicted nucleic acid-binding protein